MLGLGGGELIVIVVLAIVLIGPEKLPDAARWAGRTWGGLRRAMDDVTSEFRRELHAAENDVREATRITSPEKKPAPTGDSGDPGEVTADADLAEFIGDVTGEADEKA